MVFDVFSYPKMTGEEMSTWTTTTSLVPRLEDIRLAVSETDAILKEHNVQDPTITAKMFETLFPYILNAVVQYEYEGDTTPDEDA